MSWSHATAWLMLALFLVCALILILAPKRRNPVVMAKPAPDHRLYSVTRK